jgi:branched-chain amino acid transport system ATP-binding protein
MTEGVPALATGLMLSGITTGYGGTTVLRDVTIEVPPSQVAALIGPNGAGKTTLLRIASGSLPLWAGSIEFGGEVITSEPAHGRAKHGICAVPEGRGIFPDLTVFENLVLYTGCSRKKADLGPALEAFPPLQDRLRQLAGSLSGGEQQMLALTRCFLTDPKLVLLDEVSLGLAPRVIDTVYEALGQLMAHGVSLLLVEQYVHRALACANTVYVLSRGVITYSGPADGLSADELALRYLGAENETPATE